MNTRASDRAAVVGVVDPDLNTAGAHSTGWIDASQFERFLVIVAAGALGTSATLDAKLEQATDSSGTAVKDISGKALTQMTDGGSDSDKQALINLNADELDLANDFTHFRATMTVATASSDSAVIVLGFDARNGPASDGDLASVDEIVA